MLVTQAHGHSKLSLWHLSKLFFFFFLQNKKRRRKKTNMIKSQPSSPPALYLQPPPLPLLFLPFVLAAVRRPLRAKPCVQPTAARAFVDGEFAGGLADERLGLCHRAVFTYSRHGHHKIRCLRKTPRPPQALVSALLEGERERERKVFCAYFLSLSDTLTLVFVFSLCMKS